MSQCLWGKTQFYRAGLDLCSSSCPGLVFVPWYLKKLHRISTCSCLKAASLNVDFVSSVYSRALLVLLLDCNISFDGDYSPWKYYISVTPGEQDSFLTDSGKGSSRLWINIKINCIFCIRVSSLGLREDYNTVYFSIFLISSNYFCLYLYTVKNLSVSTEPTACNNYSLWEWEVHLKCWNFRQGIPWRINVIPDMTVFI